MTDPSHEQRRKSLLRQLEKSGLKKSEFARKLGISRSYLSQITSEGFRFGEKAARSFEERLRLHTGALDLDNEAGMSVIKIWSDPAELPLDSYALVPRVRVSSSACVTLNGESELPPLAFKADWLKRKNVSSRDNLRTCDVIGDSMSPYLEDGDLALIDTGQSTVVDDSVYAIRYGEEIRLRRLSKRFDGGLLIRPDNKRHAEESLSPEQAALVPIIGRMLWRGGGG